jgi:hypothetical protein
MEVVGHDDHVEPILKSMEAVAQHSDHVETTWSQFGNMYELLPP